MITVVECYAISLCSVEIVPPFSEDLNDELRMTLCDDHCCFSLIRFIDVFVQYLLKGLLEYVFSVNDLFSQEERHLLAFLIHFLSLHHVILI